MAGIMVGCNFERRADLGYRVFQGLFTVQHRGEHNCSITALFPDQPVKSKQKERLLGDAFHGTSWPDYDGTVVLGRVGCNFPEAFTNPILNANTNGAIIYEGQLSGSPRQLLRDRARAATHLVQYMKSFPGAYGLLVGFPDQLLVCRDPRGVRQLSIGASEDGSWFVATESASIAAAGATVQGNLEPGQIVCLSSKGMEVQPGITYFAKRPCVSEVTSRMMFNSDWHNRSVEHWRQQLAEHLASRFSYPADAVIPIPRAALVGAQAFAAALDIPYREVLYYNRYHNRIGNHVAGLDPVDLKFSFIESQLNGLRRVALVDDSVRSGETMAGIARRLRQRGVEIIHGVAMNPLITKPCQYGVPNWPAGGIIENGTAGDVILKLGLDSLTIVNLDDLREIFGSKICSYCFGGEKPIAFSRRVYTPPQST
ncbi:MAG: phosphoribosyltransferase family protein [Patescibacteria group bacterium]